MSRWPRRHTFLLALLLFVAVLTVVFWSHIVAQARAVIVLSSVLETPVLMQIVGAVTREPAVEDGYVAGNPALVVRPGGDGPWPAVFFVNGTVQEGRELPEVRRFAEGFARAGYLVVVPDLPGLRSDELTPETVSETVRVARVVAGSPEASGGRVGLVGVSTGATLALLAAGDPETRESVSVVSGVAPYSEIRNVLNVATTGYYRHDEKLVPYETDPFLSYVAARSLVAILPEGEDREKLTSELEEVYRYDPDPLTDLRDRSTNDLSPEAESVVELLANRDPECFEGLYDALPEGMREDLDELSPLARTGRIEAPVELVSGPRDKYFPVSESYAVYRIAPDLRVTVSEALDHAELSFSIREIPAFLRMNGFVIRSLREAHEEDRHNG
ncbi:MAG TPA: alpha/beta fold hydrolase [Rubrobacteraceae bacterium]|nr:alpha/beta fold hydrolase [Rubrobacteraceae bacterium]